MTTHLLSKWLPCCAIVAALALAPVAAQEEDDAADEPAPDVGVGTIMAEIETWFAQPAGLAYRPGTVVDPIDPFGANTLKFDTGTELEVRYRVGFELRDNLGDFILTYYGHRDERQLSQLTPGLFIYGETATAPFQQGVFGDGLADGVEAFSDTTLRDLRIDYYRDAFQGKRVRAKWFVGYRRVRQKRDMQVEYFALAANLPPVIPPLADPRPDLVPVPDAARIKSDYEGRGVGAGFDVTLPLRGKRLWLESGVSLAVLRGKLDTRYRSATHFFAIVDNNVITRILEPPFSEFDEIEPVTNIPVVNRIQQIEAQTGLAMDSDPMSGQVLETYLGFRVKIWRTVEFSFGFRNTRYDDVGSDVQTQMVVTDLDAPLDEFTLSGLPILRLNTVAVAERPKSVDYEGFYAGVTYRY